MKYRALIFIVFIALVLIVESKAQTKPKPPPKSTPHAGKNDTNITRPNAGKNGNKTHGKPDGGKNTTQAKPDGKNKQPPNKEIQEKNKQKPKVESKGKSQPPHQHHKEMEWNKNRPKPNNGERKAGGAKLGLFKKGGAFEMDRKNKAIRFEIFDIVETKLDNTNMVCANRTIFLYSFFD